jgi:hypothetical protein
MKKITLFISIFSMTLGFSQNLITNGDFESGAAGWSGNALNVVTEGGNSYNAANVTVAGNPWDVNLSYVLNIPNVGVNYQLTFTAWSDTNRPLIAGIGLNQPDWTNTTETVNLTSSPQTFTLNLTSNFANANSRIIFDMGNAVGFVGIDNVILTLNTGGGGDPNELPVILDFETPSEFTFAGFEGLGGVAIVPDPAAGGTNGDGFQMIHASTGNPWQGAEVVLAGNKRVRLTTNKTMQLDVYSTQAFNLLLKVELGANPSATAASYTTPGEWQTLTFNFNVPMDGTGVANGDFQKIVFFGGWNATNTGFITPPQNFTFHIDNVRGEEGIVDEPEPDPTPDTPAPIPTTPNDQVYSIYNDTNNYTTNFPVVYSFGVLSGEPDLDPSENVNRALKFNFGIAGWGQGEASGALANVSSYGFVSFDYWAQPGLPNGFRFVMISNSGGVTEHIYEIGTNEPLVTGEWKKVEIPMSYFTNLGFSSTNFFQWKVSPFGDSVDNAGFVYIDNILLTVNSVLSVNNFESQNKVTVYPNPANSMINLNAHNNIEQVAIFTLTGQQVMFVQPNANETSINISGLSSGMYIVRSIVNGIESTSKVIKN